MVRLTLAAVTSIERIRAEEGVPDSYGIRVYLEDDEDDADPALGVAFAPEPSAGDDVTEQFGSRVFVAADLAQPFADAELDILPDPASNGAASPRLVLRRTEPPEATDDDA